MFGLVCAVAARRQKHKDAKGAVSRQKLRQIEHLIGFLSHNKDIATLLILKNSNQKFDLLFQNIRIYLQIRNLIFLKSALLLTL